MSCFGKESPLGKKLKKDSLIKKTPCLSVGLTVSLLLPKMFATIKLAFAVMEFLFGIEPRSTVRFLNQLELSSLMVSKKPMKSDSTFTSTMA